MQSLFKQSDAGSVRPIAVLVDREGLGDTLLKLPFLRAISRAYPDRPIWWIATHETSMAHEMSPIVGGMLSKVIEKAGITTPMWQVIRNLRTLPPFDLVFDMRTRVPTVLLARLFLKHRGFYCCLPGYLFSDRRPPGRFSRPKGIAARALSMAAAALRYQPEWQGPFTLSPDARRIAAERLPSGPVYVGFAIGSREVRKNWPLERFVEVARLLAGEGIVPVFFSGPQEGAVVAQLRSAIPEAVFPQTDPVDSSIAPLEFALAIGERLSAAIANDSGMGHTLGALGVPLVSLFGPTNPDRWAPMTVRGIILRAQDYAGENMTAIPVAAAHAAIRKLLADQTGGSASTDR
ncbi:MAG TPA: glycosyltransferase family 9 protein [Afipia sp.]